MIIKEEYLVKRNNKNRIQIVLMQLDNTPTDCYTLFRTVYQFDGKKHKLNDIVIDQGKLGSEIGDNALKVFLKYSRKYKRLGYIALPQLTNRKYKTLTEEDLQNLLTKSDKKFVENLPLPMLPKNYNQCSPDIIETACYCTENVDGIRCFVYFQNNTIKIYSRTINNASVASKYFSQNECLKKLFEANPSLILDCFLYKQSWSIKTIVNACNSDPSELQLIVYDIVSDENFDKRLEQLQALDTSSNILVAQYTKLEGWLKIEKFYKAKVSKGFPGIIIKFPNKPYGSGKKSAYYMILMQFYKEATFTLTNVTKDGFTNADIMFTISTKLGNGLKIPAIGTDEELEEWLNNKNEYIGKEITCMFEYYTKDGLPVNPSFKCFN